MVAAGVMGLVAVAVMKSMSTSFSASASLRLITDKEAIKRTLLARTSCADSYTFTICSSPGQVVELVDKNGNTVISASAPFTQMGDFTLKAECTANMQGIQVRAARMAEGGTIFSTQEKFFIQDPFTKIRPTWASPLSLLFPVGTQLCPDGTTMSPGETTNPEEYFVHNSEANSKSLCGTYSFSSATALETEGANGPVGSFAACAKRVTSPVTHERCFLSYVRDGDSGGFCKITRLATGHWELAAFTNDDRGNAGDPFGVACAMSCY